MIPEMIMIPDDHIVQTPGRYCSSFMTSFLKDKKVKGSVIELIKS